MSELASGPAPVREAERIVALDVLRGLAILGILVMNVQALSMPFAGYSNLGVVEDPSTTDYWVWGFAHLFAETKFMTLFSILFGAGAALLLDRLESKGLPAATVHYRRAAGLLLIGCAHAYLLWYGDILTAYALCSLLLYPLRRLGARTLAIAGLVILCLSPVVGWGLSQSPPEVKGFLLGDMASWQTTLDQETAAYQGGWLDQAAHRTPTSWFIQTRAFVLFIFWRAFGLMLLGMALYKWRVITAGRSPGFYRRLAWWSLVPGLAISIAGMAIILHHDFADRITERVNPFANYFGSLGMSLGYLALVMLWCQSARRGPLQTSLAAVGRMALTNYLLQTVLCILVFYGGYGLGLFGQVSRLGQLGIVAAVWGFELLISPWWLAHFRFGPAEWLWRSMTYLKPQPMRR